MAKLLLLADIAIDCCRANDILAAIKIAHTGILVAIKIYTDITILINCIARVFYSNSAKLNTKPSSCCSRHDAVAFVVVAVVIVAVVVEDAATLSYKRV